ncbi:hypothetical protein N7456_006911 [Penicillium angulare]|uniref:Uncharacterized protein n=1 Tax=Penicillium angulare TaxID=116970 RepID=A0A9W9KC48_9EURO|nr:hypothetical protein N7456_006911 [Penicillium angulare]
MLVVVPANVDMATQEIIEISRELDPDGLRNSRILITPDLVRSEVSKLLKGCKKALQNLGEKRVTADHQRKLLLEIVTKFQRITENAPHANHASEDTFDKQRDLRLATLVANRNAKCSDDYLTHDHLYGFKSHLHDDDSKFQPVIPATSPPCSLKTVASGICDGEDDDGGQMKKPNSISSQERRACDDIQESFHDCVAIADSIPQGILSWIKDLYQESCAFELGTFRSSILSTVMKRKSA